MSSPYAHYFALLTVITILFSMGYVSIVMFLVYKCVKTVEREAFRYSFARYSSTRQATMTMSRRVMIQGVLYAAVLLYPIIIYSLHGAFNNSYIVSMLGTAFFPSQGFFNAFIYAIPSFRRMMEKRRQRAESQYNNSNLRLIQDQEQDLPKRPFWLTTLKITLSNRLRRRSKRNNGMAGDDILSHKSKSSSHSRQAVELHEHGYDEGKYPNRQNKAIFLKPLVDTEDQIDMNRIQEDDQKLCLSSSVELMTIKEATKEEEIKREKDSNDIITSKAMLPSCVLDKEEQVVKSFASSQFSELREDQSQQCSIVKVDDVDGIDLFESAKNVDNQSDDESYIDDYLKLGEIGY